MQLETADGIKLHYQESGEGQALILLPGGPGGDSEGLFESFAPLQDEMQVIAYDHRGCGKSQGDNPEQWNLTQWADDLGQVIEELELERPIILGQSFGGFVALKYAINNSEKLGGLILSSTSAQTSREESINAFREMGGEKAAQAAQKLFDNPSRESWMHYNQTCAEYYNTSQERKNLGRIRQAVLLHFWQGEHKHYDLSDELSEITCPSWIVCGEADPITPPACSQLMAEKLGGPVRLDVIANAGHGVYRDQPHNFLTRLRGWTGREAVTPRAAASPANPVA